MHTVFMGKYSFFLLSFFSRFIEALSLTVGIEQKITIAYYSFIQYLAMLYLGLLGKKNLVAKDREHHNCILTLALILDSYSENVAHV